MSVRGVVGVAALICGSLCGCGASLVHSEMVDRVNACLPKEQQFSPMWWYAQKTWRLFREYRRLFPNGKLFIIHTTLALLMFACVFCASWAIGFF
jgi:hypothetical protein